MTATSTDAVERLRAAKGFIFDMDGVLYRGETILPGVTTFLDALTLRGIPYSLATNNSTMTPRDYVTKLAGMGLSVPESSILTSGMATRDYLRETLPEGSALLVVGAPALADVLVAGTSFRIASSELDNPAAVVVGLDRNFTYERLRQANAAIRGGARFVATNADATLPTEAGLVPGCGSIVAAIAAASGQRPVIIGKPEPETLVMAAHQLGIPVGEAVMVGDRLDTDIVAGNRAGALTAMVLTGVSTREELATAPVLPDLVFNDLNAMLQAYVGEA